MSDLGCMEKVPSRLLFWKSPHYGFGLPFILKSKCCLEAVKGAPYFLSFSIFFPPFFALLFSPLG